MAIVAKQFDSSEVQFEVFEQMNVMVDGVKCTNLG